MKKLTHGIRLLFRVSFVLLLLFGQVGILSGKSASLEVGSHYFEHQPTAFVPPDLALFADRVVDGQPGVARGIYVENILALPVLQQPDQDPLFVSKEAGTATQFRDAAKNGVTGLLAHNYLSGALFFNLRVGQKVFIVYRDGRLKRYEITEILRYQKLEPDNPSSRYIDLKTGREMSTLEVFNRVYTGADHVTCQTCIEKDVEWHWGLIFIIATPQV